MLFSLLQTVYVMPYPKHKGNSVGHPVLVREFMSLRALWYILWDVEACPAGKRQMGLPGLPL